MMPSYKEVLGFSLIYKKKEKYKSWLGYCRVAEVIHEDDFRGQQN